MKTLKLSADIPFTMPSLALRSVMMATIFIVAASAFIGPVTLPAGDGYQTGVKAICGVVAIAGSLYLTKAIRRTLLQSGGTIAFKAACVAAAALCGLGFAEALSVLRPANMGHALAVYCAISACSGVLWVMFYDRAA
jgi:hypothetical protein